MKICVVGCRHNTKTFIENLSRQGHSPTAILTIDRETAKQNLVGGYVDLAAHFENVVISEFYNLSSISDAQLAELAECDIAFCIGWQRIIPPVVLDIFKHGVFGMHPSPLRLPFGRGRSPANWSIIQGYDFLFANVFKYTSDFDAGPIFCAPSIPICQTDTIDTLQKRLQFEFSSIALHLIHQLAKEDLRFYGYSANVEPVIFPKRVAKDGRMKLDQSMTQLYNFIRAQTSPYPGAYIQIGDQEYRVWHAVPFPIQHSSLCGVEVGDLLEVFEDKTFAIACGDGAILITEHEVPDTELKFPTNFFV